MLFTVYDSKAEAYLQPFFVGSRGIAIRAFKDCINSRDHQFGKHPEDYTLFYIGEFTDSDCGFDLVTPISLGNGVEFIEQSDMFTKDLLDAQHPNPQVRLNSESEHSPE